MKTLDYIRLDAQGAESISNELKQLLADIQVFYTNLRGLHWNIKGKQFFQLHEKFEELYDNFNEKADEIAERLLVLGVKPENKFSEYLKIAKIKEVDNICDAQEAIKYILESFKYFIELEYKVLETASQAGDESTVAIMNDYIKEQEKMVWMFSATLS
ncbi:MAG: DNA starvation/stationary phase protection protein [Bacteroidia bacterium]|jgi:starvation-inducible DNA-binding protein|nr:DNA starvation/stationary phase protection protein [Bacteroidales bacterium]MDD3844625.1 DNA starvation/stationary phase protection protein [Bacteroidales bacterium]MDD4618753.1 DNA starvation/stationary phase protection protein [Bacteroidales bacterium]NCC45800.1 DNA starvation/stationary phase protection protein [Bacteroidia bacterium]